MPQHYNEKYHEKMMRVVEYLVVMSAEGSE
jgi:hypothetical protein